jgi:hypothetical protein
MEFRVERGTDEVLRLECTKAKDTGIMEPMAFKFVTVELPIRNESGEPVTSAVLNQVDWELAPKSGKESAMGKNQTQALDILKQLLNAGSATLDAWQKACIESGIDRRRFPEIKNSLSKSGKIIINNPFVSLSECPPPSAPLLYKGGGSDGVRTSSGIGQIGHVSDISDKQPLEPVENSTPSNASNSNNKTDAKELESSISFGNETKEPQVEELEIW